MKIERIPVYDNTATAKVARSTTRGVYAPTAVQWAEKVHSMIRPSLAKKLGATNIRPSTDGLGFVADWPQHYFNDQP